MLFETVPGTLYVIGEEDIFGGAPSPYFKIGIVRDERTPESRLKEHQTGNPRKLVIRESVSVAAVEYLETHLHHRLATRIAFSEWFRLTDSDYQLLVSTARELATELESQVPLVKSAVEFESVVSNGLVIDAPADVQTLHESSMPQVLQAKRFGGAIKTVTDRLRTIHSAVEPEVVPVSGTKVVTYERQNFNAQLCLEENPHLMDLYRKVKISGSFLLAKHKPSESAVADFDPLRLHLDSGPEDIANFSDTDLETAKRVLDEHASLATWERMHHEAAIRAAIGVNDGIEGIAKWKRAEKVSFDAPRFKLADPELYAKYVTVTKVERILHNNRGNAEDVIEQDETSGER